MGAADVTAFLSELARTHRVSASTQHQALAALLFLYREVLQEPLSVGVPYLRAKQAHRMPSAPSVEEVSGALAELGGATQPMASLMYGSGLRFVALPNALDRKLGRAAAGALAWQWVFPATRPYRDDATGEQRRHHLHETVLQRAVATAAQVAGLTKG